jgi:hypothetical protein
MINSIAAELEKEHREKSMRNSILIHLALLLIAWFFTFPAKPKDPEKKDFAVTVEFVDFKESSLSTYAHSDPGKQRPKQEEVKKVTPVKVEKIDPVVKPPVEIPKPDPVIQPQVVDPIVSEILEEDSELEAIKEEIEIEEVEPETIEPEPELEPIDEPVFEEIPEEVVEEVEAEEASGPLSEDAAETGATASNPSSLEGEEGGTGKSDSGTGAGASSGNDGDEGMGDSGDGTGEFDGSGDGIFGRKVIYRNIQAAINSAKESGRVVAKVCINRAGVPTYAEIDEMETTISDKSTLRNFLKAIQGYRYEKDGSAAEEQCGRLAFTMDIDTQAKNEFIRAASGDMKRALRSAPEMAKFKREYKGLTPDQVKNLSVDEFKRLFKK